MNVWFDVSTDPIAEGLFVYFCDVTEEHNKSLQLRLLEKCVSHINDIVIITKADPLDAPNGPEIVFVNNSFTLLTGYSAEEAMGRTPRMLQGPATVKATLAKMRSSLERAEPVFVEVINFTKSGEEYWIEIAINPVTDNQGVITHFVAVERNITDRKAADRALKESEERFRLLADSSGAVVKDVDLVSGKIWMTGNMERYLGQQPPLTMPFCTHGARESIRGTSIG